MLDLSQKHRSAKRNQVLQHNQRINFICVLYKFKDENEIIFWFYASANYFMSMI